MKRKLKNPDKKVKKKPEKPEEETILEAGAVAHHHHLPVLTHAVQKIHAVNPVFLVTLKLNTLHEMTVELALNVFNVCNALNVHSAYNAYSAYSVYNVDTTNKSLTSQSLIQNNPTTNNPNQPRPISRATLQSSKEMIRKSIRLCFSLAFIIQSIPKI